MFLNANCSVCVTYWRCQMQNAQVLLYNLIKLTKNNMFDILIELFNRVVF